MRKPKPLGESALFDYAVRALGGRGHSIGQLREKLRGRAEKPGDVDVVLARLKEIGYVDDKRFAENYTAAKLGTAGLGKIRVLNELRQRRVAPGLAEKVVTEAYKETDETSLIETWLERKYRAKNLREWLAEEKNLASAYRRLRTAGFSSSNSIKTLKRYASQADQLEDLEPEPEV